ncbi:nucleotide sugar dehydrogenase [Halosimplex aquaticum]|uniref:UDP-glucose 6-dehydrogenase n=1 Tax=Halosimplex aquaticum TaxID=3026162 RepID=A0ABD5XTK0_9EURY|nr:nucleotide sugar dehydrogenase [Halosimplex aquaticum]
MKVSVFGLGYVGCVMTACLAREGHEVVGVDVNPEKVETVAGGESPIEEPGVGEAIAEGVAEERIEATTDATAAVLDSSVSFLTVGTPLDDTGQLSTTNLYNVVDSMVEAVDEKGNHRVVVRSTVPPSTTRSLREYMDSKTAEGTDVDFAVNPEFLREGAAMDDFFDPPYVVVGTFEGDAAEDLVNLYRTLGLDGEVRTVAPEEAESLKMVNNAFHALKICFANEVGSLASAAGVDGRELMDLVQSDRKLNVSEQYLDPGFAFGGSCLPKDSRAIATIAEDNGVSAPLLDSIPESNDAHIERVRDRVESVDGSTVGIVGIAFKSDTTDMRNSPGLRLAKQLDDEVLFYADGLDPSEAVGSNRDYLDKTMPDLTDRLVSDPDSFLDRADVVVFANNCARPELTTRLEDTPVCDPVGTVPEVADDVPEYHSVSW